MKSKIIVVFWIAFVSAISAQAQTSKAFFESIVKNEDALEKAPGGANSFCGKK